MYALLLCSSFAMTDAQALHVLSNLSQYSMRQCICARAQVPPPPSTFDFDKELARSLRNRK